MSVNSKTILLTGYEPFDRFPYNPSGVVARALDGKEIAGGYVIRGAQMPVDTERMPGVLYGLVEQHRPQIVIGLGLAFGDQGIRIEQVGHNWSEIGHPDNGGHTRPGVALLPGQPAAYTSTFPAKQIVADLLEAGIPAYPSSHAGGHLCNQMLFTALHAVESGAWQPAPGQEKIICGFVHLPGTPELAAQLLREDKFSKPGPSMSLDLMQQAVELALTVTARAL